MPVTFNDFYRKYSRCVTFRPAGHRRTPFASSYSARRTRPSRIRLAQVNEDSVRGDHSLSRGTRVHVRNVVSIRTDALPDRLRPSSSADERTDESSSAEGNVVKNSLPTRGIDRRAPCNYVLFTPHHAPALPRRPDVMRTRKKVVDESTRSELSLSLSFSLHSRRIEASPTLRSAETREKAIASAVD